MLGSCLGAPASCQLCPCTCEPRTQCTQKYSGDSSPRAALVHLRDPPDIRTCRSLGLGSSSCLSVRLTSRLHYPPKGEDVVVFTHQPHLSGTFPLTPGGEVAGASGLSRAVPWAAVARERPVQSTCKQLNDHSPTEQAEQNRRRLLLEFCEFSQSSPMG